MFLSHRIRHTVVTAAALLGVLSATTALAWWAPEWSQRKALSVDTGTTGANLSAAVSDAPVLVRLHAGNFPQFLNVRDGGMDLRFIAGDDQTPLKYHVEKFDAAAQIALAWVRLPVVNPQSADNRFYLYFGNQAAVAGADPGATYDPQTALVLHFGGPQLLADSTAYQTPVTGEAIANPASLVGQGALLTGVTPLTVADAPQLAFTAEQGFGVQLWARFDTLPETPGYLVDRIATDGTRFSVIVAGGAVTVRYGETELTSATPLAAGQWHHVAVTAGTGTLAVYLDGAQSAQVATAMTALDGALAIGGGVDGSGMLAVAIDEVMVSAVERPATRIALDAMLQGTGNDRAVTYGADERADSAGEAGGEGGPAVGHFAIIIQNVFGKKDAIVEQIVIGLCGVMMAIAILVMILKAVALSRARKASDRFLKAYENLTPGTDDATNGFTALYGRSKAFRDSPLFSVYRRGLDEIRARTSPAVGAAATGLDSKALGSLRAALDAVMVREGQKVNSQLVLLTIAISGGPFIGLLGTVVGVMVTFAAIAATGDVNIAAIAPGMAAALLATVAGLGVAIPSLFGYNYLGAKAKDIIADMHVFADEFEARVNEYYGA